MLRIWIFRQDLERMVVTAKEQIAEILEQWPDDISYNEIVCALYLV